MYTQHSKNAELTKSESHGKASIFTGYRDLAVFPNSADRRVLLDTFQMMQDNITVAWLLRLTFWWQSANIYFIFRYRPCPMFSPCRLGPVLNYQDLFWPHGLFSFSVAVWEVILPFTKIKPKLGCHRCASSRTSQPWPRRRMHFVTKYTAKKYLCELKMTRIRIFDPILKTSDLQIEKQFVSGVRLLL